MSFPLVARGRQSASDIPLYTRIGSARIKGVLEAVLAEIKVENDIKQNLSRASKTLIRY